MRAARRLTYADSRMKGLLLTLLHLAAMTAKLCGPGGVRAVIAENLLLVTFMQYDLGYFDDETCRLEPIDNPFGPKVLPMSAE